LGSFLLLIQRYNTQLFKITCDTSFSCLLSKWAKNDFMIDSMNTLSDVDRLRAAIKIHYKEKYPEIFIDTSTDAQGWIKIWCRTHILEEVLNNEN